MINWMKSRKK